MENERKKRSRIWMKTKMDFKNPLSLKLSIHVNYANRCTCLHIRNDCWVNPPYCHIIDKFHQHPDMSNCLLFLDVLFFQKSEGRFLISRYVYRSLMLLMMFRTSGFSLLLCFFLREVFEISAFFHILSDKRVKVRKKKILFLIHNNPISTLHLLFSPIPPLLSVFLNSVLCFSPS